MNGSKEIRVLFVGCVCVCYLSPLCSAALLSTEQAENPAALPTYGDRRGLLGVGNPALEAPCSLYCGTQRLRAVAAAEAGTHGAAASAGINCSCAVFAFSYKIVNYLPPTLVVIKDPCWTSCLICI